MDARTQPRSSSLRERTLWWSALALMLAWTCAFHLPRLRDPLGAIDANGGWYFGAALRAYREIGFGALRGMPVWLQRPLGIGDAFGYPNHPPGLFWLMSALGSETWCMRAPGIVATFVAAVCAQALLRERFGRGASFAVGLLIVGLPSLAVYSLISYEPTTVALGLALWLASLRVERAEGAARVWWRGAQVAVCVVGPWVDWPFLLYCAGLCVLLARQSLAASARALRVPALVSTASLALVLAWRAWAIHAPALRMDVAMPALESLLAVTAWLRPPLGEVLPYAVRIVTAIATTPIAICGVLGLLVLVRRDPRLAVALLGVGVTWPLLFLRHAIDHAHFHAYLAVALAFAASVIGSVRWLGMKWPWRVLAVALALQAWTASIDASAAQSTTFFRDVGSVVNAAARGPSGETIGVATNAKCVYPYYTATGSIIAAPVTDAEMLEGLRASQGAAAHGYRYLWFPGATFPRVDDDAALVKFLSAFPRERVPILEDRRLWSPLGGVATTREVWLVTVTPRR